MLNFNSKTIGEFQEMQCKNWFTYEALTSESALWYYANESGLLAKGYDCLIRVNDFNFGYRLARVLKSVVYVVTGELADGSPEIDKWNICKHTSSKFDN